MLYYKIEKIDIEKYTWIDNEKHVGIKPTLAPDLKTYILPDTVIEDIRVHTDKLPEIFKSSLRLEVKVTEDDVKPILIQEPTSTISAISNFFSSAYNTIINWFN